MSFTNATVPGATARPTRSTRSSLTPRPPSGTASTPSGWPRSISARHGRCSRRRWSSPRALAARTTRLKIGTAVHVLPLSNPLRTAEEAATVDHISHGRFEFGIGRSGIPTSYERFGVPYAESRDRMLEQLEIIVKAWTEDSFSYQGTYFSYENVNLIPKPYQKPHPPVRVAVNSPDTFALAGRKGWPIFVAVRLGSLEELIEPLGEYRAAWREAGHPGQGSVSLRVPIFVAPTKEEALAIPRDSTMAFYRYLGERLVDSASSAGRARHRRTRGAGRAPRRHHVRGSAARQARVRHSGAGDRSPAAASSIARALGHPGRDELRSPGAQPAHPLVDAPLHGEGGAGAALRIRTRRFR